MSPLRRTLGRIAEPFMRRRQRGENPAPAGPQFGVLSLAAAFSAALCLGWGFMVWQDHEMTRESAERATASSALALEEHAQRSFDSALLALERIADRVDHRDFDRWAQSREIWQFAKEVARGLPQVDSIALIGAGGHVRMLTTDFPAPPLDVHDRDYFLAHTANGQRTFLGAYIINRGSGKPTFTISLRLADEHGTFLGVALASMNIGYFRKFYRSLDLGPKSSAALFLTAGKLMVREPMSIAHASLDLSSDVLFTHYLPRSRSGNFVTVSSFDGRERLAAFRQSQHFPFVVVATSDMASLFDPVRRSALASGVVGILFLVFIWGNVFFQLRTIRRENDARADLAANRELADSILDSVRSHIAILDAQGNILRTNRPWRHFGQANGAAGESIGANYLDICKHSGPMAEEAASGIAGVILGARASFHLEYPCHAPDEHRWFEMHVTPLHGKRGHVVVSHENITKMKLVEEKLRCLATTDGLTGLQNRRMLVEAGETEFSRAKRYSQPLAVIMLDCDHFKSINDRYGHPAGDAVLVRLADHIRSSIRENDYGGRMGGEEFMIVLPHTTGEGAARLAERLRLEVAESSVTVQEETIRFTVSLGVSYITAETESFGALLKAADDALYQAKRAGRNRVELA